MLYDIVPLCVLLNPPLTHPLIVHFRPIVHLFFCPKATMSGASRARFVCPVLSFCWATQLCEYPAHQRWAKALAPWKASEGDQLCEQKKDARMFKRIFVFAAYRRCGSPL